MPDYTARLAESERLFALALLAAAIFSLRADRVFALLHEGLLRVPRGAFLTILGLSTFGLALATQAGLFSGIPHVTDAISHVFEAKILALGHLWAPLPPCPESFYQHHIVMTVTGKWFSKYLPGHALLLAAGLKIGALWAVVPFFSGLAAVALAWLSERFYGRTTGRVTGLLFLVSPLAILLGGSFMSHTTAIACALLGAVCAVTAIDRHERLAVGGSFAALGGFLFAWSAIIRLQDAFILGVLVAFAALLAPRQFWKPCRVLAGFALAGALPVVALAGWWNYELYGRALALGYGANDPSVLLPLYHDQFGFSDTFTPRQAVTILIWQLSRFNRALLGWPVSCIFLPIAFLARPWKRADVLCLLGCLLAPLLYFFYNYNGQEFEARYYFAAVPFALVLTARGIQRTLQLLGGKNRKAANAFVLALIAAFFVHGSADYWTRTLLPAYSPDYEQVSPVLQESARRAGLHNALVLIDSRPPNDFRYSSGFVYNDPMLRSDVIYARDLGEKNDCVVAAFSGRKVYRFLPDPDWRSGRFEPLR